jgi:hypothetical protein
MKARMIVVATVAGVVVCGTAGVMIGRAGTAATATSRGVGRVVASHAVRDRVDARVRADGAGCRRAGVAAVSVGDVG